MAGYNDYSMSNNAVRAYKEGKKPLSKISKAERDLAVELVKEALGVEITISISNFKKWLKNEGAAEWHHTSKYYNETNFYDVIDALTEGIYSLDSLSYAYEDAIEEIKENYEYNNINNYNRGVNALIDFVKQIESEKK